MNTFNLNIEQLETDEALAALSTSTIEQLPNIPPFLSEKKCAAILGVSMKVIKKLIESGQLPITDIPDDSQSIDFDLFGQPLEVPREKCILRADLATLFEKLLVCNKPILEQ